MNSPCKKTLNQCEGAELRSRGASKGIIYLECSSARRRNEPKCLFRARIQTERTSENEGTLQVINEHSETCKYIPGNPAKEFNSVNHHTLIYKNMKENIEKKLEESDWMTPGELITWIKGTFPLDHQLSYSQVDEIVKSWRRMNLVTREAYVFQHTKNRANLTFLRSYFILNYRRNNVEKPIKLIIWMSDFQLNRIRLTNHWYLDGTFTIVPNGYAQLITLAIRDPNTGFVKPAMWALLNSKELECYYHFFRTLKDIVNPNNSLNWSLSSITLDFEHALIHGFTQNFEGVRIIGCLFHFKQALWRHAQYSKICGHIKENYDCDSKMCLVLKET